MIENTSFQVVAKLEGKDINLEVLDVKGNTPEAVSRVRVIQILTSAILAIARGENSEDDFKDFELVEIAQNFLGVHFASTKLDTYVPTSPILESKMGKSDPSLLMTTECKCSRLIEHSIGFSGFLNCECGRNFFISANFEEDNEN